MSRVSNTGLWWTTTGPSYNNWGQMQSDKLANVAARLDEMPKKDLHKETYRIRLDNML